MKNISLSFKVGLFVLLALLVLGYMTVKITKYKRLMFMRGYEISALFDDVTGLKPNNAVVMAGVDVGTVKRICLQDGKAKVFMLIKPHVKIRKGAKAEVRGTGVVGTKYVEIIQGTSPEFIPEGGEICETTSVTNVDEVLSHLDSVAKQLDDYLRTERDKWERITKNLEKTTDHVAEISKKIREGKGTAGRLVNDETLYEDMKDIAKRLDRIVAKVENGQGSLGKFINDDTFYQDAKKTLDDFKTLVADLKAGKGTLGKLWKDESIYQEAKDAVERLNRIVKKVELGKGTLGKLINDDTLYKDVRETLRNVRETSNTMREQAPISVIGTAVGVVR
ncbi:MAG TPA: MCE family protein [Candidatus Desulfofervidus auxilii]|uniref:MCE family protein n=1 Tax=Desulfofervidus auxilii TaxID=1621989 RepID=A0A7V0IAM1_DESA2|nr:MCE family protein [Candidatus Desulfofervidus auxilii]